MYNGLSISIRSVLPFVSLLGMNTVIINKLRKRSQWIVSKTERQTQGQNTKNSEKQIYITLLLVTFTFLILSTPLHALIVWDRYVTGTTPYFYASYHLFYHVVEKVYYTNNGINFFLYIMSGHKFRADLVKLFRWKCNTSSPDGSVSADMNTVTSSVSFKMDAD